MSIGVSNWAERHVRCSVQRYGLTFKSIQTMGSYVLGDRKRDCLGGIKLIKIWKKTAYLIKYIINQMSCLIT